MDLDDGNLVALATAFVNQDDPSGFNPCIVDSIEECGDCVQINFSWGRGSSEQVVHPINLMAWAWNNPKVQK